MKPKTPWAAACQSGRKQKGWDAERLAAEMRRLGHLKWDGGLVKRVENNRRNLRPNEIASLCQLLDRTPEDFLGLPPAALTEHSGGRASGAAFGQVDDNDHYQKSAA